MSDSQTSAEQELAVLIVSALNLEGVDPNSIEPDAPLFKTGLGLDSIDALEIALMIKQQYAVELRSDDSEIKAIFASLRSLTKHVLQRQAACR